MPQDWLIWKTGIAVALSHQQKKWRTHEQRHTANQRTRVLNAGPSELQNQIQIVPMMGGHKTTIRWEIQLSLGFRGDWSH